MKLSLIVFACALAAAVAAFAVSVSRKIEMDLIDPGSEERALVRTFWRHPRFRRFMRQRFNRKSAGGFLLTIGFLLVFAVALVLGALLDMIDSNQGLARLDKSVAEWGSHNASTDTVDVLKLVTHLGSTMVVLAALVLVGVYDYLRHRNRDALLFLAVVGLGEWALNNGLKLLVTRDRPDVLRLVSASGSSFPSGHSAAAAAGAAAVALVLGRDRHRRTRAGLAAGAALIAVAVATSRALLGVHWLTDVIAGVAVGWGWFLLVAVLFGGRLQVLGAPVVRAGAAEAAPGDDTTEAKARAEISSAQPAHK
ncbi:MAG: phosphatase PAP2 family protein [Acidimicrobiales bacterium]